MGSRRSMEAGSQCITLKALSSQVVDWEIWGILTTNPSALNSRSSSKTDQLLVIKWFPSA